MKAIKYLFIGLVALLVIATISVWLIVKNLDQEAIKQQISDTAKAQAGIELDIGGDMGWSILPSPSINLSEVSVNVPGDTPVSATLEELQLGIELMPLLDGEVEIEQLTLVGLDASISEQGGTNTKAGSTKHSVSGDDATAEQSGPAAGPESADSTSISLAVARLSLRDSRLQYRDQAGAITTIEALSLDADGANTLGNEFGLQASFKLLLQDPDLSADTSIDGQFSINLASNMISIKALEIATDLAGSPFADKTVNTNLSLDISGNLDSGSYQIENLSFAVADLRGKASLSAATTPDTTLSGKLELEQFNLKQLLADLGQPPMDTVNPAALTSLALNGDLRYGSNQAALDNLQLSLDGSTISGKLGATDLANSVYEVQLNIDAINADDYLSPEPVVEEAEAEASPSTAAATQSSDAPATAAEGDNIPLFPVDTLRELAGTFKFSIQSLTVGGIPMKQVSTYVGAKNQFIALKEFSSQFYGGTLGATGSLNLKGELPVIELKPEIKAVQLKPALTEQAEVDWLSGTASLSAKLKTKGNSNSVLKRHLNGQATLSVSQLIASELNLEQTVCKAIALANQKQLQEQRPTDTHFDDINTKLVFVNGVVKNDKLSTGMAGMQLKGRGFIDLPADKLNYKLEVRVTGDTVNDDPACQIKERYRDIDWPLRCRGQLDEEPSKLCGIDEKDLAEVLAKIAGKELKNEAGKALMKFFTPK